MSQAQTAAPSSGAARGTRLTSRAGALIYPRSDETYIQAISVSVTVMQIAQLRETSATQRAGKGRIACHRTRFGQGRGTQGLMNA
jgi:hypothetical protein